MGDEASAQRARTEIISLTAKDAEDAKEQISLTAKAARGAKEKKSLTAKDAERIII